MDLNAFEVDTDLSQEGVWCDIADARLKVARYGNKKFQDALKIAMTPYKRLVEQGRLNDDIAEKILIEAIANHVLLGWENLSVNGKHLDYTVDNAIWILSQPEYKDFRELVISMAQEADLFRKEEVKETVEKLLNGSNGMLSGISSGSF